VRQRYVQNLLDLGCGKPARAQQRGRGGEADDCALKTDGAGSAIQNSRDTSIKAAENMRGGRWADLAGRITCTISGLKLGRPFAS